MIGRPILVLAVVAVLSIAAGIQAANFKLDASADSLVLENDEDLRYFRQVAARYSTQEFLFITYRPLQDDLLADKTLIDLRRLQASLEQLPLVDTVTSILNVPLIDSPRQSFSDLAEGIRTLETPGVDKALARHEFLNSPLYRDLIISQDGQTTALQVNLKRDEVYFSLLRQRNELREKKWAGEISAEESEILDRLTAEVKENTARLFAEQAELIAGVRAVMEAHRDQATLFLGGLPMITSDMIDYVRRDLVVFGVAVLLFLIGMLSVIFRQPRWVLLPMLCCFLSAYVMLGFLGWVNWPVTVISSNFISLLLIITMSLTVHLIVRYRELHVKSSGMAQRELVSATVRQMFKPCFYTAITTIAAFASLVVSGIRPVIDFGYMMIAGISIAFVLSFILFPASLMLLKPGKPVDRQDLTMRVTMGIAGLAERYSRLVLFGAVAAIVLSVFGISRLEVENRFIDYFKNSTEIHQGMLVIDKELGGTMPLDIIIKADEEFYQFLERQSQNVPSEEAALFEEEGDFLRETDIEQNNSANEALPSYWFNSKALMRLARVHEYIESLPETGKVLSLSTSMQLFTQINKDVPLDDLELAIVRKKIPEAIASTLIDPYVSAEGNEARISIRIIESAPNLRRGELIATLLDKLRLEFGFSSDQVRATNMLVLYNNMLQSLFRSQILTLGVVMLCIMVMFVVLFRSVFIAVVAIIPNIMSALLILGLMGIFGISLDLMSITIAAITIGIAVDNAIHYVHRFRMEFSKDKDYAAAVRRCHGSIGRAIYYTSVIIVVGFSILTLSNFIPTIYFGILTAMAMLIALGANLVLLPRLIILLKPLGNGS